MHQPIPSERTDLQEAAQAFDRWRHYRTLLLAKPQLTQVLAVASSAFFF